MGNYTIDHSKIQKDKYRIMCAQAQADMIRDMKVSYSVVAGSRPKKYKRVTARAYECIYTTTTSPKEIITSLCNKKYGIKAAFAVIHNKTDDHEQHVHVGLILREGDKKTKCFPRSFTVNKLPEYFTIDKLRPNPVAALSNPSNDFRVKMQQYYDYCTSEDKHEPGEIGEVFFHKFKPMDSEEWEKKMSKKKHVGKKDTKPADIWAKFIQEGMTQDKFDEWVSDPNLALPLFKDGLKNYDVYVKMINRLEMINSRRRVMKTYEPVRETYRPFQRDLIKELDEQDDRTIAAHADPGLTGKNYLIDNEGKRPDTLILQSAETKRIAFAWNPRKHKRIIFDIPRHKMEFINTTVIEKLKNGTLFNTMHTPGMKKSEFKPKILILGNEPCPNKWTSDRLHQTYTSGDENFELTTNARSLLKLGYLKAGSNPGKCQRNNPWSS